MAGRKITNGKPAICLSSSSALRRYVACTVQGLVLASSAWVCCCIIIIIIIIIFFFLKKKKKNMKKEKEKIGNRTSSGRPKRVSPQRLKTYVKGLSSWNTFWACAVGSCTIEV